MVNRCVAKVIPMLSRWENSCWDQHLTTETDPLSVMKHELFCSLHFDKWTSEWHPWNLCIFSFARRQKRASNIKMTGNRCRLMVQKKKNTTTKSTPTMTNFKTFLDSFAYFSTDNTEHEPECQLLWTIMEDLMAGTLMLKCFTGELAPLCLSWMHCDSNEVPSNFCNNNNYGSQCGWNFSIHINDPIDLLDINSRKFSYYIFFKKHEEAIKGVAKTTGKNLIFDQFYRSIFHSHCIRDAIHQYAQYQQHNPFSFDKRHFFLNSFSCWRIENEKLSISLTVAAQ